MKLSEIGYRLIPGVIRYMRQALEQPLRREGQVLAEDRVLHLDTAQSWDCRRMLGHDGGGAGNKAASMERCAAACRDNVIRDCARKYYFRVELVL